MSIKRIEIDGRLGADATIEQARTSGKRYMRFSIAHDEYENGTNVTEWYSVIITNESMISFYENKNLLKKGNYILLKGSFRTERRKNREGIEKEYTTIFPEIIDNIFSGRSNDDRQVNESRTSSAPSVSRPEPQEPHFTTEAPRTVQRPAPQTVPSPQPIPSPQPSANPLPPSDGGLFATDYDDAPEDLPF